MDEQLTELEVLSDAEIRRMIKALELELEKGDDKDLSRMKRELEFELDARFEADCRWLGRRI